MKAKTSPTPFEPVDDPAEVKTDPMLSRAFMLFDGLRKRSVGPDKAAYVVAQFFASTSGSSASPVPMVQSN